MMMNCPPPQTSSRQSFNAFTLVELLVVIAVIAILAAILMPVTTSVIEKSRGIQCVANLRGWASAIQAYSLDNKNNIYWYAHDDYDGNWVSSGGPYRSYFGTDFQGAPLLIEEHRRCPNDGEGNAVSYAFVLPSYDDGRGGVGSRFSGSTKLNLLSIENPSNFLLMTDAVYGSGGDIAAGGGSNGIEEVIEPITVGGSGGEQKVRHNGSVHVLFADFHIGTHTYHDFERNADTWMVLKGKTKAP